MGDRMTTIDDLARVEWELREQAQSAIAYNETVLLPAHYVLEAADTIAAFIAAQGWRPIETAPCDGSTILLFCHNGGKHYSIHTGYFDCNENDEGFRTEGDQCIPTNQECFLAWMPLPAAPSGTKESSDE